MVVAGVGVLVWKAKRAPLREAVVLVAYEDWQALHGTPSVEESEL